MEKINEYRKAINKIDEKLEELEEEKRKELKEKTELDLNEKSILMKKNAIASLGENFGAHQSIYYKLKNWENLKTAERLVLMKVLQEYL